MHNQAIFIELPGELFNDNQPRKPFPLHWLSMIGSDNKEVAPFYMKLIGIIIGNLSSKTYTYGGWVITYVPDGFPSDIKQAWTKLDVFVVLIIDALYVHQSLLN